MFWGPDFVLAIIGMAMFAGVLKTAIRARHGLPEHDLRHGRGKRARSEEIALLRDESTNLVEQLRDDNKRLTGRLETCEDRLIVLERIVTDKSYDLASQIERLRDGKEKA